MNKTMAAVVMAGTLLAVLAAASPALAVAADTQICSASNGGTMVNGVTDGSGQSATQHFSLTINDQGGGGGGGQQ